MRHLEIVFYSVAATALSSVSISVHSQAGSLQAGSPQARSLQTGSPQASSPQAATRDLDPCGTPHPEPAQSGTWAVPFCNRTGHDVVVQFHDNDCPADNWSRRGNVYEKQLARGESVMVPLCYAHGIQPAANLAPGVPQLRLPTGKGVITTWQIVGDCGDRSDRPHIDARTFYDRGNYDTGIVLLQYPEEASHCFGTPGAEAQSPVPAAQSPLAAPTIPGVAAQGLRGTAAQTAAGGAGQTSAGIAGQGAGGAGQTSTGAGANAPAVAGAPPPVRSNLPAGGPPALSATIDPTNAFSRIVHVFATSAPQAPAYHCKFRLNLDFSDGSSWVDRQQVDVQRGDENAPVMTRKYGKTVTRVMVASPSCAPSG